MSTAFASFYADDRGATLVEYGLIVGLIAVVCFAVVAAFGLKVKNEYTTISADL